VEKKIRTGGKKVKGGGMGKKAMLVLLQSSNQISKISKSIRKNTKKKNEKEDKKTF